MSDAHSTFSLLHRLSQGQLESRTYIDLLFSGFISSKTDDLLSLIRSSGLSPRGRMVSNKKELQEALNDRSWDLVFAQESGRSSFTPADIAQQLRETNRDIPIVQLMDTVTDKEQEAAVQQGIAYLLSTKSEGLILARTLQLFEQQKMRRRLHQLELGIEQISQLNRRLVDESELAIAYLEERYLKDANPTFRSLFNLNKAGVNEIELSRIFPEKSVRQIDSILKNPTASTTEILTLIDDHGAEFGARVEIFAPTPDRPKMRQIHIDHLALTSDNLLDAQKPQLLDKREFMARLEAQIHEALTGGHDAFLLYFDFKPIPTTTSQTLLQKIRHALSSQLRELTHEHSLTLLDGLSLAMLIAANDREIAKSCAQRVQALINSKQLKLPGGISSLAFSIGITSINDSSPGPMELLQRATQSLRPLNDQFSAQTAFVNPLQHQIEIDDATQELEQAIAEHKLRLFYQPLVPLDAANIEKNFEILVRMHDAQSQTRLPSQFLATLSQSRVMVQMDRWVTETILHELKQRQNELSDTRVFVNLALRTLKSKSFATWLASMLDELGVDGQRIVFEISESDAASNLKDTQALCTALRALGVKICLKHFGCSPSSLKIYAIFKPEYIKIDGSFIEELQPPAASPKALQRLLQAIERKQTRVIAPLIEDAGTLGELYKMGIDLVQGYYLQPPQEEMSYEYFEASD